ncbi:histidinol-phosphate transaminase [Anaerosacchariphilus polymeriproducens]|uniref:Histidinol-phosphate aminotransferase n=1 Tax=Anaerosacchariphilus polymeriproducens TaxID=1812858 RepID=A0A371AZM5_9FIRM|nr:histidinol-phosphate transaminase [Anaerosacchariphilus polymeriproducens]RDU25058.1 histidinol-phosphate transaminase [Anaerosacchariphilus polymeriproducens]
MSSYFLCDEYNEMEPYVPGEQPNDREYIKLNANESSFKPSAKVLEAISNQEINGMSHYSDPHCMVLREAIAKVYKVNTDQVFVGNGADEVLGFLFLSFFKPGMKVCFPDITYDFYRTYAKTYRLDMLQIPLKEDFTIDVDDYIKSDRDVILANPNNPTGIRLSVEEIERIVAANKKRMVIVDEAYVDYGNESCVCLVDKYPNLVVVQTFSKSRNMAGARIGYAISSKDIIEDLNNIKFTFNPYNLSSLALAAGTAAIQDTDYLIKCIQEVIKNREYLEKELIELGFQSINTHTNFVFVTHPYIYAGLLEKELKKRGILVRHYSQERIDNYLRITIGTKEEMVKVVNALTEILKFFKKS